MDWEPSFFRKSPLFWPIADAATKLASFAEWPSPDHLNQAFGAETPVRFVPATAKPRRRRLAEDERYDARIARERAVPTRAGSWHDLLNALVWASFPRAKLALHARQHRMILSRLGPDLRLPGARTPEQDAVAMLDEGGVVVLRERSGGRELAVIFGHAIYEGLACGGPPAVRAAAYVVGVEAIDAGARERADVALADFLARDEPIGRADFETLVVDERLEVPAPPGATSSCP